MAKRGRNERPPEPASGAAHEPPATDWTGQVGPAGRRTGGPPPAPAAGAKPPPAPVRLLTADAGNEARVVLIQDALRDRLRVAFERLGGRGRPPAAVQAFLRENGFEADKAGGWERPLDRESAFQDRIDGERIVLRAAEMMRAGKAAGRG